MLRLPAIKLPAIKLDILQMFDGKNCTDFKNLKQEVRAECCNFLETLCILEINKQKLFHKIQQSSELEDRRNKIDGYVTTTEGKEKKFQFKVKLPSENDHEKSNKLVFEISKNIYNPDKTMSFDLNGRDYVSEASMYIGLSSDFKKISFYDYNHMKETAFKYTKLMLESGKKTISGEYGCVRFTTETIKDKTCYKIMFFANKNYFKKLYKDLDFDVYTAAKEFENEF